MGLTDADNSLAKARDAGFAALKMRAPVDGSRPFLSYPFLSYGDSAKLRFGHRSRLACAMGPGAEPWLGARPSEGLHLVIDRSVRSIPSKPFKPDVPASLVRGIKSTPRGQKR